MLLSWKSGEGISSREDTISLNGTPIKKEVPKDGVEEVKNTSDTKGDAKTFQKKETPKTIALQKGTLKDKKDDTTSKKG